MDRQIVEIKNIQCFMKQQLFDGQEAGERIYEPERVDAINPGSFLIRASCAAHRPLSLIKVLTWDPRRKRTRRARLLTGRRSTRALKAQGINLTFIWIDFFLFNVLQSDEVESSADDWRRLDGFRFGPPSQTHVSTVVGWDGVTAHRLPSPLRLLP